MMTQLADLYASSGYQIILAACLLAGLVRGFSGFGTSMILMPVIAAVYSPQTAVVLVFLIDSTAAIPVVIPELRRVEWKSLLPGFAGFLVVLPLGLAVLKFGDPVVLRWSLAILIMLSVVILWSGWRYEGPRSRSIDTAIGGVSGFTGGACGLPGPPVIIYWMAARLKAAVVRANTMVFLYITDCAIGVGLFLSGILTFKRSEELRAIAAALPLDRLLVETDAPYLAPVPHRGHRNEPAYVVETAKVLAETRGMDVTELGAATSDNFYRLFNKIERPAA